MISEWQWRGDREGVRRNKSIYRSWNVAIQSKQHSVFYCNEYNKANNISLQLFFLFTCVSHSVISISVICITLALCRGKTWYMWIIQQKEKDNQHLGFFLKESDRVREFSDEWLSVRLTASHHADIHTWTLKIHTVLTYCQTGPHRPQPALWIFSLPPPCCLGFCLDAISVPVSCN